MRLDSILSLSLVVSFLLHLLVIVLVWMTPKSWYVDLSKQLGTQIKVQSPSVFEVELKEDKNSKQIVRQALAPDNMIDTSMNDPARFLSEKKQRVLMEAKAKEIGKTQNRTADLPKFQEQRQREKVKSAFMESAIDETGTVAVPKNERIRDGYEPLEVFPKNSYLKSTVGEVLPDDISIGNFTALNTDQFQFYTFYSRIEDLVRFRWESFVQDAITQYDRQKIIRSIGDRPWVTQVEFHIDATGHLVKAVLLKESGAQGFDRAAIKAFEEANVFPNPPKEMLQDDGLIHIRYSFHVNFNPKYMAK